MKTLNRVKIYCQAYYIVDVEIPDEMTFEQAEEYVKDNVAEIPLTKSFQGCRTAYCQSNSLDCRIKKKRRNLNGT